MKTSYKFGSFNMRNLNEAAITKRNFATIARIIRNEKFDVVAFQEILSEGKAIKDLVQQNLRGWEVRWAQPADSDDESKNKDKRGEGYAFAWNTKRLALASSSTSGGTRLYEPRIVSEALRIQSRFFARTPFYARFIPVNGGFFEFRLVNVHLHFGDNSTDEIKKRQEEFQFLVNRVYPAISMERRYGNNRPAYTIVMGDYNLNLCIPRGEAEKRINKNTYIPARVERGQQVIATVQDQLTTLKSKLTDEETADDNPDRGYSQNYDHFTFDVQVFDTEGIKYKYKRVDAVRKYCKDDFALYRAEISDHLPISLEIIMNDTQRADAPPFLSGYDTRR